MFSSYKGGECRPALRSYGVRGVLAGEATFTAAVHANGGSAPVSDQRVSLVN